MIPFNEAKEKIKSLLGETKYLVIPTLGRQSYIRVTIKDGQIVIKNANNNEGYVDEKKWDAVYQRRNILPGNYKNRTSQYGNPIWNSMPNHLNYILAPYIPAVMRLLEDQQQFKSYAGTISKIEKEFPVKIGPLFENDIYETTIIKIFFN